MCAVIGNRGRPGLFAGVRGEEKEKGRRMPSLLSAWCGRGLPLLMPRGADATARRVDSMLDAADGDGVADAQEEVLVV